jgi:hypothetical protein
VSGEVRSHFRRAISGSVLPQRHSWGDRRHHGRLRVQDARRRQFFAKLKHWLRKANLARLLARRPDGIFLSDFEQGEIGPDLFRKACEFALEGLVSKHRDRPYRGAGRNTGSKTRTGSIMRFERVKESFLWLRVHCSQIALSPITIRLEGALRLTIDE